MLANFEDLTNLLDEGVVDLMARWISFSLCGSKFNRVIDLVRTNDPEEARPEMLVEDVD
jgi:hypothetical protein